jgi:alginate O-acetyltransferase complex protein AlgI
MDGQIMDFSSQQFMFGFLPLVYAVYCVVGIRMRGIVLLLASLYFYASGNHINLLLFLVFLALNYLFGVLINRCETPVDCNTALIVAVISNIAILFIFKYLGFFCGILNSILQPIGTAPIKVQQFALPLGLSFLTFQAIAYLIDVYRQQITAERNFIRFSLAFAFFPKLTAGPIVRMHQIEEPLGRPVITLEDFVAGFKRIIIGLGKKLILADTLAKTADQIFAIPYGDLTTPVAWLGIVCYTLQIYFDFSGYTDMAIGLGRLFGYSLPENFDYPYSAKSLTEFWRRWHISLSTWFRDYLYIPLSYALMTEKVRQKIAEGKYKTNYRVLFSIVVVFTLCGLWHGASWNFVIWGVLHGSILALESWKIGKILKKSWAPLAHIYLILVVMFCWVFFRIPVFVDALQFLQSLSGFNPAGSGLDQLRIYVTNELLLVLGIALFGALPVVKVTQPWVKRNISHIFATERAGQQFLSCAEAVMLAAIFLASLQAVMGTVSKPFIYAQF